jgi:ribosomal protein S10
VSGRPRLRLRLRSLDHKLLDQSAAQIVQVAERTGVKVAGPIPLPVKVDRFSRIDSYSAGQPALPFEVRVHRRLIDIVEPGPSTIAVLMRLNLPAGVEIDIRSDGTNQVRRRPSPRAPASRRRAGDWSRLPYRLPERLPVVDPFDVRTPVAAQSPEDGLAEALVHDRLLLWLSTAGAGSWAVFHSACRILGIERDGAGREAQRTMRKLRLLGHIETSRDGARWSVAPTVLARTSGAHEASMVYALCGARDLDLLARLGRVGDLGTLQQGVAAAPSAVTLHLDGRAGGSIEQRLAAAALAGRVLVRDDAPLTLARLLPSTTGWIELLEPLRALQPSLYDCARFDGDHFIEEPFIGKSGFYELREPQGPGVGVAVRPTHAFYGADRHVWVRADWYGLRFLSRIADGQRCPVRWDPATQLCTIPSDWRWPEIYERVLVLATGRLPSFPDPRRIVYGGVTSSLLAVLADKIPFDPPLEVGAHA